MATTTDTLLNILAEFDKKLEKLSPEGGLTTIERDILLEKMRRLYEKTLSIPVASTAVNMNTSRREAENNTDTRTESAVSEEEKRKAFYQTSLFDQIAAAQAKREENTPVTEYQPEIKAETQPETSTPEPPKATEPVKKEEPVAVKAEPVIVKEEIPVPETPVAEPSVAEIIVEEVKVVEAPKEEPVGEPAPVAQVTAPEPVEPEPVETETKKFKASKKETKTGGRTLADQYQKDSPRTIADTMAKIKAEKDLGSQFQFKPIRNIKTSVNLNDRIMFTRELFGNDTKRYEQIIEKVNNAKNLDDAMQILDSEMSWNDQSDAFKKFMEIVYRRFLDTATEQA